MTPTDFLATIAPYAVADARTSKILPSLTIAQAILESNWGRSRLSVEGRNLFGIKGAGGDYPTTEYVGGKAVTVTASFRHYDTWGGSISDHSKVLLTTTRKVNGKTVKRYAAVVGELDYRKACNAIQAAGYATDPAYASKLCNLIEIYNLTLYDRKVNAVNEDDANKLLNSLHRLLAMGEKTLTTAEKQEIYRQGQVIRKAAGIA